MPIIQLTTEEFREKVYDYVEEKDWKYKGTLPAIIDFYADWCAPCKMVAPVLEELAKQYEGKVVIYKVDTQKETKLSEVFGIQSIPTFLFLPVNDGDPIMEQGAFPKHVFQQIIEERLLQP